MIYSKRDFSGIAVDHSVLDGNLRFEQCRFSGCSIGMKAKAVATRVSIHQAILVGCSVSSVNIGPAIFHECLVEGLTTGDHLWVMGAAFSRCVIRGHVGKILFFEEAEPLESRNAKVNSPFVQDNNRIHWECDWALDISEAIFLDLDMRSIPAERIRINSRDQVRVSYPKTLSEYNNGGFDRSPLKELVGSCLEHREESQFNFVLAANPSLASYQKKRELFDELGNKGLLLS